MIGSFLLGGIKMLKELIETYEELKKYVYVIDRGTKKPIVIKFNNDNFYHLVGLHKINLDMFFPTYIKSKSKKYKFMKNNIEKFNRILENQSKEKHELLQRINSFKYIIDLLTANKNTILYDIKEKIDFSKYDGDYGLCKLYIDCYCLLGLKSEYETDNINSCVPQSWMASYRPNRLIINKRPLYIKEILKIPYELYNEL